MGAGAIALAAVRGLVVLGALGVVVVGVWSKVILHNIETRGVKLPPASADAWRALYAVVLGSRINAWVAIATASFVALANILILLSTTVNRLRIPTYLLLPLEYLAMLAIGACLGATLSLTLKLDTLSIPPTSPTLRSFRTLLSLTIVSTVLSVATLLLALTAALSASLQACHRVRDCKACSFEPSHGHLAAPPQRYLRDAIPTLYDPKKLGRRDVDSVMALDLLSAADEEKGFAGAGVAIGRRRSGESVGEISGPLGLQWPERVAQIRPARPWSGTPKWM